MLDFYEPPDPYVPAAEWAVVNVSGQRFHINMKHIKEYHKGKKYGIRLVGKIEKLERFKLGRLYRSWKDFPEDGPDSQKGRILSVQRPSTFSQDFIL